LLLGALALAIVLGFVLFLSLERSFFQFRLVAASPAVPSRNHSGSGCAWFVLLLGALALAIVLGFVFFLSLERSSFQFRLVAASPAASPEIFLF
jgi:hypothetical protein